MKRYVYILFGPIVLCLVWLCITQFQIVDTFFLPSPITTITQLAKLLISGKILPDLYATTERVIVALTIGSLLGIPVGLFLGWNKKVYESFEFVIDFFRSTPSTALFPLFLLIFGISDFSKISVAIFAAFLVVIFNTAYGVMHANKSRMLMARMMGAGNFILFKSVIFWESLPQTFIGLRSGASMALMVIVVTEMFVGTEVGIGRKIIDAQITYDISTVYALIILSGIVGYLLNLVFLIVERKVVHWNKK